MPANKSKKPGSKKRPKIKYGLNSTFFGGSSQ
jgi:hypothetical protein